MTRVAIVTDDPGWHGARLRQALAVRGVESSYVSLTDCRFDLAEPEPRVVMPGFDAGAPDGVFVRGVAGGSLEQVTFHLAILHALRRLGVAVYNDAGAIERTVDKGMTSFLLKRAGIATPPTWVTGRRDQAEGIVRRELEAGQRMVTKPLFGSQGEGLQLLEKPDAVAELTDHNGVFYLQRFVPSGNEPHDWRVFVINGKTVAAMRRCGVTWLNNVAQGARCEPVRLDDLLLCRIAEDAVRAVGMAYAGVDIIRDPQGRYWVIEINSVPAWKGLQSVTDVNIAERLAEDFLGRCAAAAPPAQAIR